MKTPQPLPVIQPPLEKAMSGHSEPLGIQKTKNEVPPKAVSTRSRHTNKKIIFTIALIVFILFAVIGSMYSALAQSQLLPFAKSTPTKMAANIPQNHQNQIINVPPMPTGLYTPPATITQPSPTTVMPTPTLPSAMTPTNAVGEPQMLACAVTYTKTSDANGNFVARIAITNNGTTTINGWSLSWTYANDQSIYASWGSSILQNGTQVTLQNLGWDKIIQPGTQINNIGFSGKYHQGVNIDPTQFTLNGVACN
jgi:hypothetical protein